MTGTAQGKSPLASGGLRVVLVGAASFAVGAAAVATSDRPLLALTLLGTLALGAAAWLAVTRFELLTLLMIAGRTAIDLAHGGPGDETLRLSVLITGAYTVVSIAWLIVRWSQHPLRFSPISKAVAVLTATAITSGFLSEDRVEALTGASRWIFLTIFVVVLDNLVKDERAVRRLLLAVCASTIVPLAVGLWQFVADRGRLSDGISRVQGSFAHPNTYGFYLAVIGIALLAVIKSLPTLHRVASRVLLLLVTVSLIVTYSRTSYVAFAAGVLVLGIAGRRWLLLAVTLIAIAAAPLVPAIGERLADIGEGPTLRGTPGNSLTWRLDYWKDVIEVGEGRRVTGVGLGVVSDLTEQGREPHSDFVRSFVELGALGLAAYVGFLFVIGVQARGALRRTRTKTGPSTLPRGLAEALAGIYVAYLVESLTGNPMTQLILLWYVLALAVAAVQLGRNAASDTTEAPVDAHVLRVAEPISG